MRALWARCGPFGPAGRALRARVRAPSQGERSDHPPINNALGGGGSPIALVHFRCVIYMVLILLYVSIFVCLVAGFLSVLCSFFSLCYVLFVDAC